MKQSKWKSKVLWLAVGSQVVSILLLFGVFDVGQSELVNQVISGMLQILVLFGVLNNPNDAEGF